MSGRRGLYGLLAADVASGIGTRVSVVAIPWLVLVTTEDPAKMGLIAALEMLPYAASGALAAPLADRFGLRRTSIVTDVVSTLAVALIAAVPNIPFPLLALLVAVAGGMRGVGDRVRHVLLRPMVEPTGIPMARVTAAYEGLTRAALLVGAPLGGLLVFWFGAQGAIWVDAVTFAVSAVLVLVFVFPAALPPEPREGYFTALAGGARFLFTDKLLVLMLATVFFLNVFGQASVAVYIPLWVNQEFGTPAALGLLLGGYAAGAVTGALVFTVFATRLPRYLTFALGALLSSAPRLLALVITDDLVLVLAITFASGVATAAVNPILGAVLYERVPVRLQTRVFGLIGALAFLGLPIGGALAGELVTWVGLDAAITVTGLVALAVTTLPLFVRRGYGTTMPELTEETDPHCLAAGEAEKLLAGHPWRRFVVLGDSVAAETGEAFDGYRTASWVRRIEAALREQCAELEYLNLGVSGRTAAQVRAEQLADALAFRPDLALVVCGGNDAFSRRYTEESAGSVDAELSAMITELRAAGAEVITVGMFDVSHSPAVPADFKAGLGERMRLLSERTGRVAAEHGTIHVHLTSHPAGAEPTLYSSDGKHGNARSDAIAAAEAIRRLGTHLAARTP